MNPEIQAILSGHNLPPSTPLSALSAHLTGDELARVHHLLKYPNEQTEPKGGRMMVRFETELQTESMMLESAGGETEARIIIQGMSSWALKNMIRALSIMELLNTPAESMRLKLAKQEIKSRKAGGKG